MQCPICAAKGVATVLGRVDHMYGRPWGAPTPGQIAHDDVARKWFLRHCDSLKCIRGQEYATRSNWYDSGGCVECDWNPYNHIGDDTE